MLEAWNRGQRMAQITQGPGTQGQVQLQTVLKALGKVPAPSHPALQGPHALFSPPAPTLTPALTQTERLGGMDVLRGVAMLLGVYVHACISYLPSSLSDLVWGIREQTTSPVLAAVFWWVHTIRLPLFFVIAGFFTLLVYDTKGPQAFVRHRARRLLLPLLVGLAVLLPLSYLYFWSCGVVNHLVSDPEILSFQFDPQVEAQLLGPAHLWFLQDLVLLTLVAWAAWHVKDRLSGSTRFSRCDPAGWPAWVSAVAPLALAVPAALILWARCTPLIAHRNTFVPDLGRLAYYGLYFASGTMLYRYRGVLPQVFAWPCWHLALSVPVTAGLLGFLPGQFTSHADPLGRLAFVSCAALLAWLSIFGFMGLALRGFKGRHPVAHYLADASYWIYLVHMPLVCLLQLDLFGLPWGPEVKCAVVIVTAVALGLLSYHAMVRYTFIGNCLHGPRKKS
jgi:glucans biosynthesis protein C